MRQAQKQALLLLPYVYYLHQSTCTCFAWSVNSATPQHCCTLPIRSHVLYNYLRTSSACWRYAVPYFEFSNKTRLIRPFITGAFAHCYYTLCMSYWNAINIEILKDQVSPLLGSLEIYGNMPSSMSNNSKQKISSFASSQAAKAHSDAIQEYEMNQFLLLCSILNSGKFKTMRQFSYSTFSPRFEMKLMKPFLMNIALTLRVLKWHAPLDYETIDELFKLCQSTLEVLSISLYTLVKNKNEIAKQESSSSSCSNSRAVVKLTKLKSLQVSSFHSEDFFFNNYNNTGGTRFSDYFTNSPIETLNMTRYSGHEVSSYISDHMYLQQTLVTVTVPLDFNILQVIGTCKQIQSLNFTSGNSNQVESSRVVKLMHSVNENLSQLPILKELDLEFVPKFPTSSSLPSSSSFSLNSKNWWWTKPFTSLTKLSICLAEATTDCLINQFSIILSQLQQLSTIYMRANRKFSGYDALRIILHHCSEKITTIEVHNIGAFQNTTVDMFSSQSEFNFKLKFAPLLKTVTLRNCFFTREQQLLTILACSHVFKDSTKKLQLVQYLQSQVDISEVEGLPLVQPIASLKNIVEQSIEKAIKEIFTKGYD